MNEFYSTSDLKDFDLSLTIDSYKDQSGKDADVQINYLMKAEFNDKLPSSPSSAPIAFRLSTTSAPVIGDI
jgi:hypothetical protein